MELLSLANQVEDALNLMEIAVLSKALDGMMIVLLE
jgi:hypothetical protein